MKQTSGFRLRSKKIFIFELVHQQSTLCLGLEAENKTRLSDLVSNHTSHIGTGIYEPIGTDVPMRYTGTIYRYLQIGINKADYLFSNVQ